jgi:pyridoxamine 5'-phosphate oxidase
MDKTKIASLRNNYMLNELLEKNVFQNPIIQFSEWFNDAVNSEIKEANAMVLSTVSNRKPKARVVLLKGFDELGFVFFTNYNSHKGAEIEENNFAALTFFWDILERQVRVEGQISKITEAASCEYFWSRPRTSQIGAWVSHQSETLSGREILDEKLAFYNQKFESESVIPKPPYWGGYLLKPENLEFWQGRPNRLHDRILYSLANGNWNIDRLSP